MEVHESVVGRTVSFFHANEPHLPANLIRGVVVRHLGDGIVLDTRTQPYWFGDMVAFRKH